MIIKISKTNGRRNLNVKKAEKFKKKWFKFQDRKTIDYRSFMLKTVKTGL